MAAMDEQLLEEEDLLALQLYMGEEVKLSPWDDEPFVVTHVFLVDPESAAGQGVVATAGVKMGTRNIMLVQLSSEVTEVELETPVVLHEESCFYVMWPAGGDTDADTNTDKDAVIVQFEGYVLYPDTDEESEVDEESAGPENDDDGIDKEDEKSESDGWVFIDVARDGDGLQPDA